MALEETMRYNSSASSGPVCRCILHTKTYSRSKKVGNPIASIIILKSSVQGIPALFGLYPASNFLGFTITAAILV